MRRAWLHASLVASILAGSIAVGQLPVKAAPVPNTTCQVMPSDNVWNTDISAFPTHPQSSQWLASMAAATTNLHPDFGTSPYGFPFNIVDNTHPLVSVTFQYPSESDAGPYPVGSDTTIESGSDHHALIINKDTCTLYELYNLAYNGSSWTAGSGAIFPLTSDALRPLGWTSADAAGLPIFPGLVRWDEVQSGVINHAIRVTAQQTDQNFLWPARHQAGTANPALPPMGARFRLKASYDITHFSTQAQVILRAMQHYGLIVADNGSNWFFSGTEDSSWPDSLLSELKTVPASQFDAIDESSLMVDPNSASVTSAELTTRVTNQQYSLTGSDGTSWRDLDPNGLGMAIVPATTSLAFISANADLWTATPGYNQDLGISIDDTLQAWKESGGFNGAFSPNAAYVQSVVQLQGGAVYFVKPQWKANRSTQGGTIYVGAGQAGNYSPTRLTVHLLPLTNQNLALTSGYQYPLSGSDGITWKPIDPPLLGGTFSEPVDGTFILGANADLWTAQAGLNQDIGIGVNGTVVAWKESGGFAGTFSPNAAFVQTTVPVKANTPYNLDLRWKTNKPEGSASIYAGAGPDRTFGKYSPTSLSIQFVPTASVIDVSSTSQYRLAGNDGRTWADLGSGAPSYTMNPSTTCKAVLTGNADLWTAAGGYNQDLAIVVNGQISGWKESGGFAGTFSPNAAAVQVVQSLAAGASDVIKLQWKTNKPDPSSIYAGAGSVPPYSPTRMTIQLVGC